MEHENIIESAANPRIKAAVKLRKAKVRRETGQTLVEGIREIQRAMESGWNFLEIYYCPELYLDEDHAGLIQMIINQSGIPVYRCSEIAFRKISYRDTPDGLLALSPLVGKTLNELELPKCPLVLIAEDLEKPGNLGTMLRTADAAGVNAVITCDPNTDINNPNVIRASIGSLFFIPVAEASTEETYAWLKKNNIQSIAAVPDAQQKYTAIDMSGGTAIVVGSEDDGLSTYAMDSADQKVSIPMLGKNDSLNVSTAAAILLYEAVRQRNRAL